MIFEWLLWPVVRRIDRRLLLFLTLSTLVIAFGVQGFEHGAVNNFRDQSIQIPIIDSYAHPDRYVGDFLLDARGSYVTWFYWVLGLLSRFVALDFLMLVLYVLTVGITISGVYMLGETLFPRRNVGLTAVILWMAYFPNPGGDFIHSPFVTHTLFAIALQMWVLVFIFRKRLSSAAFLLGITANINAMTAVFVASAWMSALLADRKAWSWTQVRIPLIIQGTALPILWWRMSLPLVESALDEFVAIVRLRLWYAVFPSSISTLMWIGFVAVLILWFYSFRYGKPENHAQILHMSGGIGALGVIGTVFTELLPVEFVIELQLIRGTWLINVFALLYFANMVQRLLINGRVWRAAFAFGLTAAFAIPRWIIELAPPRQPTPYSLYVDLDTLWEPTLRPLLVFFLVLLVLGVWYMVRRKTPHVQIGQALKVSAWSAFSIICLTLPTFIDSSVPDQQVATTEAWKETLNWIERHTPEGAVFVTPPVLDGFRVITKRAQVGDWKDGTLGIFYNGWAVEWKQRMIDLGFSEKTFSFEPLTTERLCLAADRYGATHAVVFREWSIRGQLVFENEMFAVLPVAHIACSGPQQSHSGAT